MHLKCCLGNDGWGSSVSSVGNRGSSISSMSHWGSSVSSMSNWGSSISSSGNGGSNMSSNWDMGNSLDSTAYLVPSGDTVMNSAIPLILVMKAGLAFTRFQVVSFLSFPAVKQSLPVGCIASAEIPALCLYKVFSTCQLPILVMARELSSLALNRCEGGCVAIHVTIPSYIMVLQSTQLPPLDHIVDLAGIIRTS